MECGSVHHIAQAASGYLLYEQTEKAVLNALISGEKPPYPSTCAAPQADGRFLPYFCMNTWSKSSRLSVVGNKSRKGV